MMPQKKMAMQRDKKIELVAHENKKRDLVEWVKYNRALLAHHAICATGTRIADGQIDFLIFSGSRSSRSLTTWMSKRSCAWRSSGTSPSPATAPRPIL